jgi:hypothetical protein
MNANQNDISRNGSKHAWWVGGLLMVAAALAVWLAFRATAARPGAPAPAPLGAGQSAPGANVQSVSDYLIAQGEPAAADVLSLPASLGSLDAVLARDSGHPFTGQILPGANTESVADYLIRHGEPPAAIVLSRPASQGSLDAVLARDSDHPVTQ